MYIMPKNCGIKKKRSNLEAELYLLIAKFLNTGPCKRTAEVLRQEIEEHHLLPRRVDWLGNEHSRSFNELDTFLSQISDDHLLKICTRIGPILDREIPSTVPGLTSLLGVGKQSLLRTKEELQRPKCQLTNLMARKNGMPLFPSPAVQATYPPNITQVLMSRELSGAITSRHAFSPKIYARQQLYRRLLGHLSSVYCVLFDRTGKYIFTGADDLLVKIWCAVDGRLLATLRGHSAEITDMAVNYENTLLAAGSCDKTIRVWCLRTTAPVAVLNGHTGMVTSLQFCPFPKNEDQLLISTGNDGCICFWQWNPQTNVFNPKPLKFTERNKAGAQMICSSFSPGGLFLATGSTDHNVRVYNIAGTSGPEKILEREVHVDRVDSLQFSNLDCRFISGSKDGTALIWKYEKQNWSSIHLKMSTKLAGQSDEIDDPKVKLRVTMVGWTLDDSRVITAVSDCAIKVWNSNTGALCHILKGHEDEVFVLEAHPTDPRIFLSSGHDGRIIIWDLITGSLIKNHFNLIEGQGHGAVFDCKFSPDGLMFASTDSHGHLCIFGFGSNDRYKKVPEEQFFHTDYRPLIRDIHHHVLDEQTQMAPHLLPPPFLVDIDGNPYPPNFQRLVPGREHCNESQLVPYVAVSAEGEAEILEPVRSANDAPLDRPTIDDMIERLQQEQQQNLVQRDHNESNNQGTSSDSFQSPRSSHRPLSGNGDRAASEPFSPRTPRSQAGHSRVGLRRTGDVEGVQSVGNWQSRGNQNDLPSWVKRVVVKPMKSSLSASFLQKRTGLADQELNFFNRERKTRLLPDLSEMYNNQEKKDSKWQHRQGLRAGLRSRTQDEAFNNVFGGEFENPETWNTNTSSDSESEQKETWSDSTEESSGSGEYSDWIEDVGLNEKSSSKSNSKPSTSGISSRPGRACRRVSSSDEESDAENGEEEGETEEASNNDIESHRKPHKEMSVPRKKTVINGKKLPERFRPPEWLTDVMPHKAPYVPQIGDEILYFRQGHELYVQAVKRNRIYDIYMRSQPWRKINLRDQEVARIEDITFENHPPRLCCLKLCLLNPASKNTDMFTVKYHDMADVIDFIVLKQNYDQAMCYDWKSGDRFRSAIDKAWWLGTIKAQKPLNANFPDSMFQCFLVKWDNGEKEHMSPWDFEPIDNSRLPEEEGGSVEITPEERLAMMYIPEVHEWSSFGREHDCDRIARGLTRIMGLSIAEPFVAPVDLNLYPSYAIVVEYPMDLGTIKARVQNRFYRRLEAIKFDVKYIGINAQKFNEPTSRIVKQAKCVVDLCIKFIDSPHCRDPMVLYHEMMEAKQSRSQDSQSELDVLCSESDSDKEHNVSNRLKRKKQNAMQQSSKRARLGSQKYTSNSWKQQCSALLDSMFQMDDSTPFRHPVNLNEYPDYRNIIDCPVDLSLVRERLENNHYDSPTDFCKDMRLIFQNSRTYNTNKKSRIYSMTIRLSAMFEEHIRAIVSDWRSAVKYEEKIRNNQYVSNRRKPLPIQDSDVNVGASTSRSFPPGISPLARSETSRNTVHRVVNAAYSESNTSRTNHSSKIINGSGPRKKLKQEEKPFVKSSVCMKKKFLKKRTASLANGVVKKRIIRASKRKLPEKSSKKLPENTRRKAPSNIDESESDLDASNHSDTETTSSESEDSGWRQKTKRRNVEPNTISPKRLRPRHVRHTRYTRSSSSYQRSPLSSHSLRESSKLSRLVNHSKNHFVPAKKLPVKNNLSPLHTRSKRRLRNSNTSSLYSLRKSTVKPQKYQSFEESSESDDASESHSSKSGRNSNSSGCSNTSSSTKNTSQNAGSSGKSQHSSNSELDNDSESEEQRPRRLTRTATTSKDAAKVTRSALNAPKKETPRKLSSRIQTRNRGQRTVRYGEYSESEEDYGDAGPAVSLSSRGRLRSHVINNDVTRRMLGTPNRINEEKPLKKPAKTIQKESAIEGSTSDSNASSASSYQNTSNEHTVKICHKSVAHNSKKTLRPNIVKVYPKRSRPVIFYNQRSLSYSSSTSSSIRSASFPVQTFHAYAKSESKCRWLKLKKRTTSFKSSLHSHSKKLFGSSASTSKCISKIRAMQNRNERSETNYSESCSSENGNAFSKYQSVTNHVLNDELNKKWSLRSSQADVKGDMRSSYHALHNPETETSEHSSKIQTRNCGRRTTTYEEDIDDDLFMENVDSTISINMENTSYTESSRQSLRDDNEVTGNKRKSQSLPKQKLKNMPPDDRFSHTFSDSKSTNSKRPPPSAFNTKNGISKISAKIQTRNSKKKENGYKKHLNNAYSKRSCRNVEPVIFSSRGRLCKLTSRARAFLRK